MGPIPSQQQGQNGAIFTVTLRQDSEQRWVMSRSTVLKDEILSLVTEDLSQPIMGAVVFRGEIFASGLVGHSTWQTRKISDHAVAIVDEEADSFVLGILATNSAIVTFGNGGLNSDPRNGELHSDPMIRFSTDGITWTSADLPYSVHSLMLADVVSIGNGHLLALCFDPDRERLGPLVLCESSDHGRTWTGPIIPLVPPPCGSHGIIPRRLLWVNESRELFLVATTVCYSTDDSFNSGVIMFRFDSKKNELSPVDIVSGCSLITAFVAAGARHPDLQTPFVIHAEYHGDQRARHFVTRKHEMFINGDAFTDAFINNYGIGDSAGDEFLNLPTARCFPQAYSSPDGTIIIPFTCIRTEGNMNDLYLRIYDPKRREWYSTHVAIPQGHHGSAFSGIAVLENKGEVIVIGATGLINLPTLRDSDVEQSDAFRMALINSLAGRK